MRKGGATPIGGSELLDATGKSGGETCRMGERGVVTVSSVTSSSIDIGVKRLAGGRRRPMLIRVRPPRVNSPKLMRRLRGGLKAFVFAAASGGASRPASSATESAMRAFV